MLQHMLFTLSTFKYLKLLSFVLDKYMHVHFDLFFTRKQIQTKQTNITPSIPKISGNIPNYMYFNVAPI